MPTVVTENAVISSPFGKRFLFGKYSSMIYIEHIFTYHAASIKILLLPAHQHVTSLFPKQATCLFRGKIMKHEERTCQGQYLHDNLQTAVYLKFPSLELYNLFSGKSTLGSMCHILLGR